MVKYKFTVSHPLKASISPLAVECGANTKATVKAAALAVADPIVTKGAVSGMLISIGKATLAKLGGGSSVTSTSGKRIPTSPVAGS